MTMSHTYNKILTFQIKNHDFREMFVLNEKWGMACDFEQCGILTSVDLDEPVQPPLKLRNSKWCSVTSLTLIEYSSD